MDLDASLSLLIYDAVLPSLLRASIESWDHEFAEVPINKFLTYHRTISNIVDTQFGVSRLFIYFG